MLSYLFTRESVPKQGVSLYSERFYGARLRSFGGPLVDVERVASLKPCGHVLWKGDKERLEVTSEEHIFGTLHHKILNSSGLTLLA